MNTLLLLRVILVSFRLLDSMFLHGFKQEESLSTTEEIAHDSYTSDMDDGASYNIQMVIITPLSSAS